MKHYSSRSKTRFYWTGRVLEYVFFLILILLLFQTAVSANGTARESAVPKVWYTCRIYLGGGKGTHGE